MPKTNFPFSGGKKKNIILPDSESHKSLDSLTFNGNNFHVYKMACAWNGKKLFSKYSHLDSIIDDYFLKTCQINAPLEILTCVKEYIIDDIEIMLLADAGLRTELHIIDVLNLQKKKVICNFSICDHPIYNHTSYTVVTDESKINHLVCVGGEINMVYNLKNNEGSELPTMNTTRLSPMLLYQEEFGLLCVGGENENGYVSTIELLNTTIPSNVYDLKWEYMSSMKRHREGCSLLSLRTVNNKFFACGTGVSGKLCEMYDNNGQWNTITQEMHFSRSYCGIQQWNDQIVVIGGEKSPKNFESYNLTKGIWSLLKDTAQDHTHYPCVYAAENTICVFGNFIHSTTKERWGTVELYDFNSQKWQNQFDIRELSKW